VSLLSGPSLFLLYNCIPVRIIIGIFLLGVGLIIDSFIQMKDFAQGGYLDDELRSRVLDAIWKFTLGFGIIAGFVYIFLKYFR